jgi:multidrug efflux pump
MKLPRFFIEHPVISIILNAMIVIVGLLCLSNLSVREYPKVNLPAFSIQAQYPNASAELVESAVTNPLEEQLAGVEGLDTMTSYSRQGNSFIEMIFKEGSPLDRSLIVVRDAIELARPTLPKEVLPPMIQQKSKSDGPPFIAVSLESAALGFGELTHYANLYLKNALRSLKGVASIEVWGQPYTMEVTLNPKEMHAFGVNAEEVLEAIEKNNLSWPVGKFREQIPTTMDLTLSSVDDFENLLIKEKNGKPIFLSAVASIKLKTDDKQFRIHINGKPGLVLSVSKTSDANPLDVSDLVNQQIDSIRKILPQGVKVEVALDQSSFIRASLKNIRSSIVEAIILVLIVVFLFLRSFRATLIPLITIPISLIGAVILLASLGFSINTITLLAMVLAIGLVVDDAIVVLENIARHLEEGLSPLEAAIKGSREIGFAIVAMTLTLASVYAPIAFVKGAVGQLFIEFAVALAGSVLISGIVALTLSPMMCGYLLKADERRIWQQLDGYLDRLVVGYQKALVVFFGYTKAILITVAATVIMTLLLFKFLPSETAPKEDRGLMGVFVPLIPGKDINAIEKYATDIEEILKTTPEAKNCLTFIGHWGASICLSFKDPSQRKRSPVEVVEAIKPQMKLLPSIDAWPWSWDSGLPGMDNAMEGSSLQLAISIIGDYKDLFTNIDRLRKEIEEEGVFKSVRHDLRLDTPGYEMTLDAYAMSQLGITPYQIAKVTEIFFSGMQSLYFQKDGIRYPITIKGGSNPWTLNELYLTNAKGKKISLGSVVKMQSSALPKELYHHNQMRSTLLTIDLDPSQTLASSMPKLWKVAQKDLPDTFKKEWVGSAKAYIQSSLTMLLLFGMALVFIYAILAIQFESFMDPFIIMLTVPLACCGALFVLWVTGQSLNIYTQIGLITLIGLITKHGILIVEFANQLRLKGLDLQTAIQQAAVLRLRPILMTTAAMIFGAIPLILLSGEGAEARRAIGSVLIGGLCSGTVFTLFVLPKIYSLLKAPMAWPRLR